MPNSNDQVEDHVSAAFCRENVAFNGRDEDVLAIAANGPRGAASLAGLSVLVLLAIWIAFFFLIFAPRGNVG
jgi:hypothetical protein